MPTKPMTDNENPFHLWTMTMRTDEIMYLLQTAPDYPVMSLRAFNEYLVIEKLDGSYLDKMRNYEANLTELDMYDGSYHYFNGVLCFEVKPVFGVRTKQMGFAFSQDVGIPRKEWMGTVKANYNPHYTDVSISINSNHLHTNTTNRLHEIGQILTTMIGQ